MRFIIVTGLSGAGKSEATKSLEDMGYFCVDNLPPTLITKFAEACRQSDGKIDKVALVIDIRGGVFFNDLFQSLRDLEKEQFKYEISEHISQCKMLIYSLKDLIPDINEHLLSTQKRFNKTLIHFNEEVQNSFKENKKKRRIHLN